MNTPLPLLARVGHHLLLSVKENLSVVQKIHLKDLVGKSEHDGVLSFQPLL